MQRRKRNQNDVIVLIIIIFYNNCFVMYNTIHNHIIIMIRGMAYAQTPHSFYKYSKATSITLIKLNKHYNNNTISMHFYFEQSRAHCCCSSTLTGIPGVNHLQCRGDGCVEGVCVSVCVRMHQGTQQGKNIPFPPSCGHPVHLQSVAVVRCRGFSVTRAFKLFLQQLSHDLSVRD
jgi:hypothetical protein